MPARRLAHMSFARFLGASAVAGLMVSSLSAAPSATAVTYEWQWGDVVTMSTAGTPAYSPVATISADGAQQAVLWLESDGSRYRSRVAVSPDSGASWDDSQTLSASGQNAGYPDLAMTDDGSELAAVWTRYNGSAFIVQGTGSDDSGTSWSSPANLSSGVTSYQPSVEISPRSSRRIAGWQYGSSPRTAQISVADDSASWGAATDLSTGTGNAETPSIALSDDGQQAVAVWNKALSPFRIQSAASSDGAITWSATETFPAAVGNASGPTVVVSDDGTHVMTTWLANDGSNNRVYLRTSDDSAASWNSVQTLSPTGFAASDPALAVSGDGATAVVGWSIIDSGTSFIQVAVSADSGQTWSATPVTISDGATATDAPKVLMSDDGSRVVVAWSEWDGSDYSLRMNSSFDSGQTWTGVTDIVAPGGTTGLTDSFSTAMSADGSRLVASYETSASPRAVEVRQAVVTAIPAPPAPPPAPKPSGPPLDVTASSGDFSASITWKAPRSSGSFAVSHFQAVSSPAGRTCLVAAPALSCEVTGLSNGTSYTFTVRALTGAGWSPSSEPSNAVTPEAAPRPSVVITGSREGKRIEIAGRTTGLGIGAELRPWTRFPGQSAYSEGAATILVSMEGTFEWGRKTGKRVSVYVRTPDGSVRSNVVTIGSR